MFTYFTEVVKTGVVDKRGNWIGKPYDFIFNLGEPYPRFISLVIAKGLFRRRYAVIPWSHVNRTNNHFTLTIGKEGVTFASGYQEGSDTTVRKHILDQQVVDTFNRKIVRVNDIHLLRVDNDLRIAHVDVGLRGIVRRLGWGRFVDIAVKIFNPHSNYLHQEAFISWKYVQPLSLSPDKGTIQLNVGHDQIRGIPPPDLSEMFADLDQYQRVALFRSLETDVQVEILSEMDAKQRGAILKELEPKMCAAIFDKMPSDEATDLLGELPRRNADNILNCIETKKARKLTSLLKHRSSSAGGLMTTEVLTLPNTMTVGEAIEHIRNLKYRAETIYYAYVVDGENHLEGVVTFKHLLFLSNDQKIADIMVNKPVVVRVDDSAKEVAYIIDKYNFLAVPVVSHDRVLQGIITIDDVLSLVIAETWGRKKT